MDQAPLSPEDEEIELKTLELFARAGMFNRWMFKTIKPYCRGRLLEVGSGIGNLSSMMLEDGYRTTLSELRPDYCTFLKQKFRNNINLEDVIQVDIAAPLEFSGQFDTIIALNVVEHIKDDKNAIRNCIRLLNSNGRLIILVPAYQYLYNSLDKGLGHFRRYNKSRLTALLQGEGLKLIHTQYFNCAGLFGWWLSGNLLKRKRINTTQLKIYITFLPLLRTIDKLTGNLVGLSVIAVAEKSLSV